METIRKRAASQKYFSPCGSVGRQLKVRMRGAARTRSLDKAEANYDKALNCGSVREESHWIESVRKDDRISGTEGEN
jgi:hypothetical protein